ncbi:hypothetical protein [Deinococcus sp. Marseille-Q6407]|uniref:hypothetical protein n=1 Tax=Deinococcus sp. Marseille-Q6407 TaxID=2969223 RepID=UPI0021BE2A1A|nr:hypothetical protein [Deinococcus sp. Marseille-Q6407]
MKAPTGPCQDCSLWQKRAGVPEDQSADFIHHRPCRMPMRLELRGSYFEDGRGRIWTAPDASCFYFAPKQKGGRCG